MSFFGDLAEVAGGGARGAAAGLRQRKENQFTQAALDLDQERIDSANEQKYLDRLRQTRESRAQRDFDAAESEKDRLAAATRINNQIAGNALGDNYTAAFGPEGAVSFDPILEQNLDPETRARIGLLNAQRDFAEGSGRKTGGAGRPYSVSEQGEARRLAAAAIRGLPPGADPGARAMALYESNLANNPGWGGLSAEGIKAALMEEVGEAAITGATMDPMDRVTDAFADDMINNMGVPPLPGYEALIAGPVGGGAAAEWDSLAAELRAQGRNPEAELGPRPVG